MNDDDQLLQFLDEEEFVIKTESYSTIVNSFQTPPCLSKNNQTENSASLRRLLAQLPSGISISKPDRKLSNVITATVKPAGSEAGTQTLLQSGQPRFENKVEKKDKSSCINLSHDRLINSFIFHKAKSDKNTCCDRCKKKGLKVCEKHSPIAVSDTKKITNPEQPEFSTLKKNTCVCPDNKSSQIHKSLIIMSSGRCNQCNRAIKEASITSICIESLFNQAKAYLQQLAEDHKNKCPRCNQRPSCQNLQATGSKDFDACKEALFEQARVYLTKLASEHKGTCERCQKKEPQQQKQACPAVKEANAKPTYMESILQQAWSYIQNLRAGKRFCCVTNRDCCPRCMKMGLPTCCKHSPTSKGICQPCKPAIKPPEKKIDCPRCKEKKHKSVCLKDCPSDTTNKNICQHCKDSLDLESKSSCCPRCKKDGMPVCCKHQNLSKDSSSDTTSSSRSITSLFDCLKKQANDCANKSCPKLGRKKSSEECFSPVPVPRCKSEEPAQCSFDPCEASQSCCKSKPQKKSSCTGLCSKSSESLEEPRDKPCIGPCTKKCPVKRSGCDFLEYHSSTVCSGPCKSNSMNKKMTGIKLTITPKMSDAEFCKHSCDAVKKVFCPAFPTPPVEQQGEPCTGACVTLRKPQEETCSGACRQPEEPQEKPCTGGCGQPEEPQEEPCTGACYQPEEPQGCTPEDCQGSEQVEEEEPEQSSAPGILACISCHSQFSSTKDNNKERRMVDANYEAFLDDQFGRMVAKELADKETICDKSCDCITCLTNLRLKSAHSEDLNRYRFYY